MSLQPEGDSELAVKSHWDGIYTGELKNLEDSGVAGEEWFSHLQSNILRWIDDCWEDWAKEATHSESPKPRERISCLDVGTGNGLFTYRLANIGFRDIIGTDYSSAAVAVARRFHSKLKNYGAAKSEAHMNNFDEEYPEIEFDWNEVNIRFVEDDMTLPVSAQPNSTDEVTVAFRKSLESNKTGHSATKSDFGFDFVHDKAGLDVMFLARKLEEALRSILTKFCREGTVFVWSSCNLSQDEMVTAARNISDRSRCLTFKDIGRLETGATYTYQGRSGKPLSTIAFAVVPMRE